MNKTCEQRESFNDNRNYIATGYLNYNETNAFMRECLQNLIFTYLMQGNPDKRRLTIIMGWRMKMDCEVSDVA